MKKITHKKFREGRNATEKNKSHKIWKNQVHR